MRMKAKMTDWRDNGLIEGATIIAMIATITILLITFNK